VSKLFCYIHIPFCESKCKYCRFASVWILQEDKIQKYVDKLLSDIQNYDKKINRLKSIYFWWWTPSVLSVEQLENIILSLKNKFWFEDNIEITLESTPQNISENNIVWWKKMWINRLSIWIQTLNEKSLEEIWRRPPPNPLLVKEGGEDSLLQFDVSLDFIIGLPYVKKWEIKKDIEYILDNYNYIKHISVYMLEDYYYPDNWKKVWINEDNYLWEYVDVKDLLESRWFDKYEISNFAPPSNPLLAKEGEEDKYQCKHNKAYWDHSEVVAFWLGAHWFVDWKRYSYPDNFKDYYNDKIIIEDKLTEEDVFLEKVMFWLRTRWLEKELFLQLNQEKLDYFLDNWYLKIEDNILKLQDKWVVVLDYILSELV